MISEHMLVKLLLKEAPCKESLWFNDERSSVKVGPMTDCTQYSGRGSTIYVYASEEEAEAKEPQPVIVASLTNETLLETDKGSLQVVECGWYMWSLEWQVEPFHGGDKCVSCNKDCEGDTCPYWEENWRLVATRRHY